MIISVDFKISQIYLVFKISNLQIVLWSFKFSLGRTFAIAMADQMDLINARGNFCEEGNIAILPQHEKNGIYYHDID